MINSFKDAGSEDIFNGVSSKRARKTCPEYLWDIATRKLDMLNAAISLSDLKSPPSNHLEKLKGDRDGQFSIRINGQYRICFSWTDSGPSDVEIVDYH